MEEGKRERERGGEDISEDGKGCFDIPIDLSCELKLKFADSLEPRDRVTSRTSSY